MHVRIDEPGHDVAPRRLEGLAAVVCAEPSHDPVDDRDVGVEPFPREHREHAATAYDEVGGLVSAGHCQAALQLFHRGERNARRAVV